MTKKRAELLAELLNEIVTVDNGFIPEEAWMLIHRIVCLPAVEILITRNQGKEFLLCDRKDTHWDGWHIPGSYIRRNESIEETCNRIAQNDEIEIQGVTDLQVIVVSKWNDHPYGAPLSLVVACHTVQKIKETKARKFFSSIPNRVITRHERFLKVYLDNNSKDHLEHAILI